MQRFTTNVDGPVHGLDFGGEGRLVLAVHGLGGSSVNWAEVGSELCAYGRVIAPDLPGFGRTPPNGRSARIDDQAAFLAKFIEESSDDPAVVIGNSMGGLISMLLAARHPHLVERLILVNPASPSWTPNTLNPAWAVMMGVYLIPGISSAAFKAVHARSTPERRTEENMGMIAADASRVSDHMKHLHAQVARERESMPWITKTFLDAYASIMRRLVPPARFDRIVHRITADTLLMHGTRDGIVPFSASERTAGLRPDWTFAALDDTGHIPMLEAREAFLKVVDEFMGQHQRTH